MNLLPFSCKKEKYYIAKEQSTKTIEPIIKYGVDLTGMKLRYDKVKAGERISDILLKNGVKEELTRSLVTQSQPYVDARKIKAGCPYLLAFDTSGNQDLLRTMILEQDKLLFTIFYVGDSLKVINRKKEINVERKYAAGLIENSLYETLEKKNIPADLAITMADIFSCSVDFYRLKKGDYFKVIYNELLIDGKPAGIERVLACLFHHDGKDYSAYYFCDSTQNLSGYFDEEGNDLRRQFLKAPLKFFRISSRYSKARLHPVTKVVKAHLGTDYAAPAGTPIMATANGVVKEACYKAFNGNYVKIKHSNGYETQYLHMRKIAKGIKPGKHVKQGEVIGYVGSTGLATGPHVCYRFWFKGKQIDPLKHISKTSESLPKHLKPTFLQISDSLKNQLAEVNQI
ncbi:MAG: peptidoglycan DD-metalloendopeptidase family protein [Chitinophagales bacterium]|nr:peptidoglycan DD-metalloendopeptidase family protein [Chitinophagales bacterium]MDW8273568.1 peptidoglycan DD-metalloendopeptidase family protein [Chitinophagales bacterium]